MRKVPGHITHYYFCVTMATSLWTDSLHSRDLDCKWCGFHGLVETWKIYRCNSGDYCWASTHSPPVTGQAQSPIPLVLDVTIRLTLMTDTLAGVTQQKPEMCRHNGVSLLVPPHISVGRCPASPAGPKRMRDEWRRPASSLQPEAREAQSEQPDPHLTHRHIDDYSLEWKKKN